MNIVMVGAGYVGLVSGSCFSELGHNVTVVDIDSNKINSLKAGQIPFYEPGLDKLVNKNSNKTLFFSDKLTDVINQSDVIFICVGTPPKPTGQANMQYVYEVAESIGQNIDKETTVVTKSTVPIGTAQKIKRIIGKHYKGTFHVCSCPEFLREGTAIADFQNPDRIVIGTKSPSAEKLLLQIHEKLQCQKIITNVETAEMIKYAANAFLATKISFINEIANVCENVGADVNQVAEGMGLDKRIGRNFLNAGIGYGGSCFPKDIRALHHIAGQNGYPFQLLKSVIEVNNNQRWLFYKRIKDTLKPLAGKTIAVWGLSFKPNTDDIRESIAADLIEKLIEEEATIQVFDPEAMPNFQKQFGDKVKYAFNAEIATNQADALLIITEWDEFKNINLDKIKQLMKTPIIFDGRNMYDQSTMKQKGFEYYSIGR
jgi:UDPglucose 6-dehydrogenase